MAVERRLMTADELWALPDDRMRRELVRGELRTMAPAGFEHGGYELGLAHRLGSWLDENPIGELVAGDVGFRLARDPDTVLAPDVAFVRADRIGEELTKRYFEGAPDLAVEVVSPGDTAGEVEEKVREWLDAGTRLVWVVFPAGPRLRAHLPDGTSRTYGPEDEVEGGDVLPGFRMRLRDLLRRPGQRR